MGHACRTTPGPVRTPCRAPDNLRKAVEAASPVTVGETVEGLIHIGEVVVICLSAYWRPVEQLSCMSEHVTDLCLRLTIR